jgi:mRNA-degrading endonuclease RelE of RelBE toxin-antitoxin system
LSFEIEFAPEVEEHLQALTARQRTIVFDAIDNQLIYEPMVETRNKKPMRPNALAPWELRIQNMRVYYDIEQEPEAMVVILAIGVKDHNRILIGGKEIEL